ncbi:MAG: hypothetical protein M3P43_16345, partial [Actinomycetota bacterium]|nr:hypothetical protein [Actinomycetota bacterium]
ALYGVLVVVVLTAFTGVDLLIRTLATSTLGDVLFITLAAVVIVVLALEHPRERIVQACRRLIYGIDPDPVLAMRNLSERLAASVSSDDILSALADVTRRSIGVSAGELEVRWPDGAVNSGTWPDGVRDPWMQRIDLRSHDDALGAVAVRKVTRLRLTKKEQELVQALATAAALAMRARTTPAHA